MFFTLLVISRTACENSRFSSRRQTASSVHLQFSHEEYQMWFQVCITDTNWSVVYVLWEAVTKFQVQFEVVLSVSYAFLTSILVFAFFGKKDPQIRAWRPPFAHFNPIPVSLRLQIQTLLLKISSVPDIEFSTQRRWSILPDHHFQARMHSLFILLLKHRLSNVYYPRKMLDSEINSHAYKCPSWTYITRWLIRFAVYYHKWHEGHC